MEQTATDAMLYYMYYMSELSEYYAFLHTQAQRHSRHIFDFYTHASQKKMALHFIYFYVVHIAQTHN